MELRLLNKLNNNIRTKQMRSFKLLTLIGILFLSTSLSAKDPCAPLGLPAEMKASKILFVMPTYVEYTTEVAMYALNMGVNINDKLMSEEERYQAFRDKKTKTIAKIFNQEYKIVTSRDYKQNKDSYASEGYNFTIMERVDINALQEKGSKNLLYSTNFILKQTDGPLEYPVVDLSRKDQVNCVYPESKRSYNQVLEALM